MAGGDPFKKATPGQKLRIPAAAYNAFIDSALDFQRRQRDQRGKSRGRPGDESCCNASRCVRGCFRRFAVNAGVPGSVGSGVPGGMMERERA